MRNILPFISFKAYISESFRRDMDVNQIIAIFKTPTEKKWHQGLLGKNASSTHHTTANKIRTA